MLEHNDHVGVAVSGGPDSIALLMMLCELAPHYKLTLAILHMNHGLRGRESDREEAFVKVLAESMGIPAEIKSVSVPLLKNQYGGSTEEVSRNARYTFFHEAARTHSLSKIALGHTLNDQAETILINFMRGSGLEGLRGILPVRDGIYIHPLIETKRCEIEEFLNAGGIRYLHDSSNDSGDYLRNRVRHSLIPEIERIFDRNIAETIIRAADIIRIEDDFMRHSALHVLSSLGVTAGGEGCHISIQSLQNLHPAMKRRMVKYMLEDMTPEGKGISYRHVEDVVNLIEKGKPSGEIVLPFRIAVRREYDTVTLSRIRDEDMKHGRPLRAHRHSQFHHAVTIPGHVTIPETGNTIYFSIVSPSEVTYESPSRAFADLHALSMPLSVRSVHDGDRMQPLGMSGSKKLKDLFIDEKIPRRKRNLIPIVVDGRTIVWVPGVRLSDRVRITDSTEKVVKMEII